MNKQLFWKLAHVMLEQMYERRKTLKVIMFNRRITISCDGWDIDDTFNDVRFAVIEHGEMSVGWTMMFTWPNKYIKII